MVNCQVGFWDFYDVTINSNNHKFQMTLTSILKLITCLHVWYHTRWWDQITAASRTVLNFVSGTPAWYSDLAFQISWKIFFAVENILSAGSVEAGIYMYFLASLAIFRKHDSCLLYTCWNNMHAWTDSHAKYSYTTLLNVSRQLIKWIKLPATTPLTPWNKLNYSLKMHGCMIC